MGAILVLPNSYAGGGKCDDREFDHSVDYRVRKNDSSPEFLDAVGRLIIEYSGGREFTCSASLVDTVPGRSSRVLATARHCIVHKTTGARPYHITWVTKLRGGGVLRRDVVVEFERKETDIALLSFSEAVDFSIVKPLLLEAELFLDPDVMAYYYSENLVAAGYSADRELGQGGNVLTYHECVRLRTFRQGVKNSFGINTWSYGGASGGPLIAVADMSEEDIENPYAQQYFLGSLMGGSSGSRIHRKSSNGVEGSDFTMFSYYTNFYKVLDDGLFDRLNGGL